MNVASPCGALSTRSARVRKVSVASCLTALPFDVASSSSPSAATLPPALRANARASVPAACARAATARRSARRDHPTSASATSCPTAPSTPAARQERLHDSERGGVGTQLEVDGVGRFVGVERGGERADGEPGVHARRACAVGARRRVAPRWRGRRRAPARRRAGARPRSVKSGAGAPSAARRRLRRAARR